MKLNAPLNAIRNATTDIVRMHDFNYQFPKEEKQNYWEKECRKHPSNKHCLFYCD